MRVARAVVLNKQETGVLEQISAGTFSSRASGGAGADCSAGCRLGCEISKSPRSWGSHGRRLRDGATVIWMAESTHSEKMRRAPEGRHHHRCLHRRSDSQDHTGKPFNATHWSTRTMAAATGLSETTVRRSWRANGLKPHLVKTLKSAVMPSLLKSWKLSWVSI